MVYLARQTDLDRFVALKELAAFHASDASFAQRFLRESRVAGSLSHPNIVTVHDYFEHDGTPYIAMEYVERGSLRPFVGNMTLAQIGGVLEGLLAGLALAEQNGIVHRDLKPENLMVTSDGRVKIADFGIAKATRQMQTGAFLTATGTTVGTPTYMAPEQAMAQDIGPWTDLYSVGCMAFEMFTGRVPFHDSDAPMAILLRHVNEEIPAVKSIDPSIDQGISDWIDELLVKDPKERTQSANDAWDELEELVIGLLGPRWRRSARLSVRAEQVDTPKPLTPAPFEGTSVEPLLRRVPELRLGPAGRGARRRAPRRRRRATRPPARWSRGRSTSHRAADSAAARARRAARAGGAGRARRRRRRRPSPPPPSRCAAEPPPPAGAGRARRRRAGRRVRLRYVRRAARRRRAGPRGAGRAAARGRTARRRRARGAGRAAPPRAGRRGAAAPAEDSGFLDVRRAAPPAEEPAAPPVDGSAAGRRGARAATGDHRRAGTGADELAAPASRGSRPTTPRRRRGRRSRSRRRPPAAARARARARGRRDGHAGGAEGSARDRAGAASAQAAQEARGAPAARTARTGRAPQQGVPDRARGRDRRSRSSPASRSAARAATTAAASRSDRRAGHDRLGRRGPGQGARELRRDGVGAGASRPRPHRRRLLLAGRRGRRPRGHVRPGRRVRLDAAAAGVLRLARPRARRAAPADAGRARPRQPPGVALRGPRGPRASSVARPSMRRRPPRVSPRSRASLRRPTPPAFKRECEGIADTLQIASGKPFRVGPDPAYAKMLDSTFAKLDEQVAKGRRALTATARSSGRRPSRRARDPGRLRAPPRSAARHGHEPGGRARSTRRSQRRCARSPPRGRRPPPRRRARTRPASPRGRRDQATRSSSWTRLSQPWRTSATRSRSRREVKRPQRSVIGVRAFTPCSPLTPRRRRGKVETTCSPVSSS